MGPLIITADGSGAESGSVGSFVVFEGVNQEGDVRCRKQLKMC